MAILLYHHIVLTDDSAWIVRSDGFVHELPLTGVPEVQIYPSSPARFAVLKRSSVLVNAVSQPIWFDTDATSHYLGMKPPATPPGVAAGAGTGLSGNYQARVSFLSKNSTGQLLAESPLGPISAAATLTNQNIAYTALPLSAQAGINARRIYRTAADGAEFFHVLDVDDNTTTSLSDGTPDESIDVLSAPTDLATAPSRLTNIVEWKGRLWGVSANLPDQLRGTAQGKVYAWPLTFEVLPSGADMLGISGFLPRRDELGVIKRNILWKIVGDSEDNFRLAKVVEGVGCISPDTCKVVRDVGYFLGGPNGAVDGVYSWSGGGVECITDESVRPWFDTDDYFNREEFRNAVSAFDPKRQTYTLFACSAGSTTIDRWVTYDIRGKRWLGPHKTALFSPTCAFVGYNNEGVGILMFGGANGHIYKSNDGVYTDGSSTAIEMDVRGKFFSGATNAPDITHVWLRPVLFIKAEAAGTMNVIPRIGDLTAAAGSAIAADLTLERQHLPRLGTGRLCQIQFSLNTAGRGVTIYGFELDYADRGSR